MKPALIVALVSALTLSACKPDDPRTALFDCRVAALTPLVGTLLDARELVQGLYASGTLNLEQLAAAVGKGRADAVAARDRLVACDAPVTPSQANPDMVQAAADAGAAGG